VISKPDISISVFSLPTVGIAHRHSATWPVQARRSPGAPVCRASGFYPSEGLSFCWFARSQRSSPELWRVYTNHEEWLESPRYLNMEDLREHKKQQMLAAA
jgi:hypothetical protein